MAGQPTPPPNVPLQENKGFYLALLRETWDPPQKKTVIILTPQKKSLLLKNDMMVFPCFPYKLGPGSSYKWGEIPL